MDINHDFDGTNEFVLTGSAERLQMVKNVILSFGDMGYTDPAIPDIRYAIGEYTDAAGQTLLADAIREALMLSQVVRPEEILDISITSQIGSNEFTADLSFTFGGIPGLRGAVTGA